MPATVDIVAALSRRQLLAGGLVLTAGCTAEQAAPAPPGAPYADKLTAIAPTVVISFEGLSLKDVTTKIGTALGRSPQARDLLRTYDTKAAGIRQRHAAALAKLRFAFASPTGSGAWWLYGPDGKIAPENAELTKTAMWKRLPAVRAGRVYPIPYGTSSPGTAITLLDAFDRLLGPLA